MSDCRCNGGERVCPGCSDLAREITALRGALNDSYSFVKAFHWLTPEDEPIYTRRKNTLKSIEELLNPKRVKRLLQHADQMTDAGGS